MKPKPPFSSARPRSGAAPAGSLFFFAALAATAAFGLCGCKKESQAPATPPEVEVVAIEQRDVPVYREWVGSLVADVSATISAQVGGYLLRQEYTEGQLVKKGDVLFQIDDRTYQTVLDQAMARLRKTQLDVERYTPLAATQAISQQELDDAILANQAAQAAVEDARLNVQFCRITSPVDGLAGLARAQIGDLVGPGSGLLTTVATVDPMKAYFSVDQALLTKIQERNLAEGRAMRPDMETNTGTELQLIMISGAAYPEKGRVSYLDNQVDVKTGTIRVVGMFPNPHGLLVQGMFMRIRALVDTDKDALVVPQRAVTDMQGRSLVAVVGADNKVSIKPVTTGERYGELWVVQGDLKAGDRVVAEGIQKVRDGSTVNPIPFGSAKAAAVAAPTGDKQP